MELEGKTAVVTGGSSGIGRAITAQLLGHGVTVHLVCRRDDPLPDLEQRGAAARASLHRHRADLGDSQQVARLLQELVDGVPSLDLLVHSAGVIRHASIETTSVADFDLQLQVNLRAPFVLTRGLLPLLKASGGQILFVNSSATMHPAANTAAYAASKAALRALADGLREEVNHAGVRVISVYPGRTATPMQETVHRWESRPYRPERLLQPADVAAAVYAALTAARTAETTDLHIRPRLPNG